MMSKAVFLFALLALSMAAPAPSNILTYAEVYPAVESYSSYSDSVVHGTPIVSVPLVESVPVVQAYGYDQVLF
ncbi:unnamed protein product [Pieris macdunnoughi]|uniref:Uncharacterized protein n=1 Tax=Pieris macdunnoughi TaxID=345717 RepID=A0A821VLI8_9NEOP|nr:unnamed protein product [Pieris macdunnoughi]